MSTVRMCAGHVRTLRSKLIALGGERFLQPELEACDYAFTPDGLPDLMTLAVGVTLLRLHGLQLSQNEKTLVMRGACLVCVAREGDITLAGVAKHAMDLHLLHMASGGTA